MHEYDLIADWYASERDDQTAIPEVNRLAAALGPGSRILDAGCGNGLPIARALLDAGHHVIGLDTSLKMLARFRNNCPGATSVRSTVENCPFPSSYFDAAVAISVMFHLKPDDQVRAIASFSRVLKPSSPLLFTSGDVDGLEPKEDTMHGVTFRYYSFSTENYRRILSEHNFNLNDVHQDKGQNTYYLATRR